ncbi:hypothetical protein IFM89_013459 [Coptis chinensis]|uniref:CRAL-TRIO domain-containing protein n=1 Tax=Coptis chinensis TaxID=261450 RepID=A0A835LM99_9MAGN|nr:hypothetical protein IFM89_013459 [Coptis chinensis]
MGDYSFSSKKLEIPSVSTSTKRSKISAITAIPKTINKRMDSMYQNRPGLECAAHIAVFLFKVAARRISKAKCPVFWSALQLLCYPPFKWIQRWAPLRASRVIWCEHAGTTFLCAHATLTENQTEPGGSIGATAFSEQSESDRENSDASGDSQPNSEPFSEPPVLQQTQDIRSERVCDESPQSLAPENWLIQLYKELEKQNLTLLERINEDELRRFFAAANGDYACFFSSVKKTIRWRETYNILSVHELQSWSHLVFWHGYDVKLQPFLFVRLGLACTSLPFHERPRFTQAIGLTPFNFPMQILRSCSSLVQDHYPNCLGCLFIIRLAPVVRVVAQTFIQVLKPVTRQKLRIEGVMYKKVLSEYLQTVPSFLGGDCVCPKCSTPPFGDSETRWSSESSMTQPSGKFPDGKDLSSSADSYWVSSCC